MLLEVSVPFGRCAKCFDTDFAIGVPSRPRAAESKANDKLSSSQPSDALLPKPSVSGAVSLSGGGTGIVLIGDKQRACSEVGWNRQSSIQRSVLLGRLKQDGLVVMGR